jgi:hypothetical protein
MAKSKKQKTKEAFENFKLKKAEYIKAREEYKKLIKN